MDEFIKFLWSQCPPQAQYIAMDGDTGEWYWYIKEPQFSERFKCWDVAAGEEPSDYTRYGHIAVLPFTHRSLLKREGAE